VKNNIIANHMGTWKYKFLTVSLRINLAGTGSNKPPMIVYASNRMQSTFHQSWRMCVEKFLQK
jgi:hypothetical protein